MNTKSESVIMKSSLVAAESVQNEAASRPHTTTLFLLFVEDSAFDCSLLVRLLQLSGFNFEWRRVEDEASMRAALDSRHWDAIIADHNLPNFSSTRALEIHQELGLDEPFIIVSGEIGEGVAVEAMLAGADDYVLKSRLARLPPALTRSLRAAEGRRLRLEAESALRESEAQLRSITSNLPGMVFQISYSLATRHWQFEYVSEGVTRILGEPPQRLFGNAARLLDRVSIRDREQLENLLHGAIGTMSDIRWQARIAAHPVSPPGNGEHDPAIPARWIELSGSPRMAGTEAVMWEGVIMDVTPQKAAEEALMNSREDLRALSVHLENVKENERKAIARDMHDDIGGILASLKFDIAWLQTHPPADAEQCKRIAAMAEVLESARHATYRIIRDLRPGILNLGIVAAIEWLVTDFGKHHGFACSFTSNRESISLPEPHCTAMFRIAQEILTNIIKHANASAIRVEIFEESDAVTLEIVDDGDGILEEDLSILNRFGIRGMRERAANLGGWIEVHGSTGKGTCVMLYLPKNRGAIS